MYTRLFIRCCAQTCNESGLNFFFFQFTCVPFLFSDVPLVWAVFCCKELFGLQHACVCTYLENTWLHQSAHVLLHNLGFFLWAMWLWWRRLTPLCVWGRELRCLSCSLCTKTTVCTLLFIPYFFSLKTLCAPSVLNSVQRTASAGTEVAFLVCPKVPVCG